MTDDEIWKPIPGYDGYEASSHGRIRRVAPRPPWHASRSPFLKGSVHDTGTGPGYRRYTLSSGGRSVTTSGHRLVALAFHGVPPEGRPCAAHLDGDRLNNAASNIVWASYSENENHKVLQGVKDCGVMKKAAKLNDEAVVHIRKLFATGTTCQALGDMYSVTPTTAYRAAVRMSWRHVP